MNDELGNPTDEINLLFSAKEEAVEPINNIAFSHPLEKVTMLTGIEEQREQAEYSLQERRLQYVMPTPASKQEKNEIRKKLSQQYPPFNKLTENLYSNLEVTKLDSFLTNLSCLKSQGLDDSSIAKILPPQELVDEIDTPQNKSKAMQYVNFISKGYATFATTQLRKQGGNDNEIATAICSIHKLREKCFTYKDMKEIVYHSIYDKKTRTLEVLNDEQAIKSLVNISKKSTPKDVVEKFKTRDKYLTKVVKKLYSEEESKLSLKRKASDSHIEDPIEDLDLIKVYFEDKFDEISQYEPITKKDRFSDSITKNDTHANSYLSNKSQISKGL